MNNRTSRDRATLVSALAPAISGAVANVIVGMIAGIGATLGLFFSPLQKVIFGLMWKEKPAVTLLVAPSKAIEGDVVGIDIIVSPLNTAVGLSGGTMTLTVDGKDARLLLDNAKAVSQEVSEFGKVEGQKVFHRQLIAAQPGRHRVKTVITANSGYTADATREIEVAERPAGTCKYISSDERSSSFQGQWRFDFNTLGSFEVNMQESGLDKLSGEFRNSQRETGSFEGGRDGSSYFGTFTFHNQPLKRIKINAEYRSEGNFLITPGGDAILETLTSAKRYDWKPSRKESIAQGYCRLH